QAISAEPVNQSSIAPEPIGRDIKPTAGSPSNVPDSKLPFVSRFPARLSVATNCPAEAMTSTAMVRAELDILFRCTPCTAKLARFIRHLWDRGRITLQTTALSVSKRTGGGSGTGIPTTNVPSKLDMPTSSEVSESKNEVTSVSPALSYRYSRNRRKSMPV